MQNTINKIVRVPTMSSLSLLFSRNHYISPHYYKNVFNCGIYISKGKFSVDAAK